MKQPCSVLVAILCFGLATSLSAADERLTFEKDVRPILKAHCFQCHGEEDEPKGGLDVRLRRFLAKGGESGPAIIPGNPAESLLLNRMKSGEMPPVEDETKKVPAARLAILEAWIEAGAPTARPEPESISAENLITDEERSFWAFQPVLRQVVPIVEQRDLVSNPIDAFLLHRLEERGLSFSSPASPTVLIRRASFDLHGLLPEPEAVQSFLEDDSPHAWARLVDRLLASPFYGDRWGRHWLDVAGYADSEGYTNDDIVRPWAWKYRDYVISAMNADKPFDQFIVEQLAGDELAGPRNGDLSTEAIEQLTATGFLRMAPDGTGGGADDAELAKNEVMAETLKVVSTSLLAMTVGCAQCHDHRYDPIPQADYYRLRAIFEPAYDWKKWRVPNARRISLYTKADRDASAQIEVEAKKIEAERTKKQNEFIQATFDKEVAKLPAEVQELARKARTTAAKERTPEQKALLKKHPSLNVSAGSLYLYDRKAADELKKMADEAKKLRDTKPKEEFLRALTEVPGQLPKTFLFARGDHEQPKQELEPAGLTVLQRDGQNAVAINDEALPTSGRRLTWARQLTSGSHPLPARVIVNRVWMHHFSRGLVSTPGDFGVLGDRPSHPELLDWLASEFVDSGWSLKHLHRLIMTSTAYRQALRNDPAHDEADPDNALFGGARLKRLDAETLRDAILTVSGKRNDKRHGPPVPVMFDRVGQFVIGIENLNAGRPGPVIPMRGEEFRKTIFVQVRRSRPLTVLDTFDLPRMEPNCTQRNSSTVATQSLLLMNSTLIVDRSIDFANRVREEAGTNLTQQVERAWRIAFSRSPTADETADAVNYLQSQTEHFSANPVESAPAAKPKDRKKRAAEDVALAAFCQTLLSSNEFLYVD